MNASSLNMDAEKSHREIIKSSLFFPQKLLRNGQVDGFRGPLDRPDRNFGVGLFTICSVVYNNGLTAISPPPRMTPRRLWDRGRRV
jgi:hypothetical protein